MNLKYKFEFNLKQLNNFTKSLVSKIQKSDIILLEGELGSGKTTFARLLIKNLYILNKLHPPNIISSPSYPILQIYSIKNFSIYHYDLYRIKHSQEIVEMGFEENFKNNISIIEWPEKILPFISSFDFIKINMIILNSGNRILEINSRNINI